MVKNSLKNSDKSWMRERKKELEALLDFSTAEIKSMEASEIAGLAYKSRLFEGDSLWQSFILKNAFRESDPGELVARKRSLLELQRHLRERLEKILSAVKTGDQTPILEISGATVFSAHPVKDRFLLNLKEGNEADSLKKEKARLDLRLLDLVRILGLRPRRFKECPECQHIFYQPGFKERIYCSTKCGGAQRQSRFRKKIAHSDLEESHVDEERKEAVDELKNEQSSMDGDL